ncbi:DUF883 family protein [Pseudohoeflea coraliihabitans]|uniref:DUF883 family protein n=1 Tax=Pseudohoeflea coraliihabitans TaxID=2860393 RepID=A0ABS6WQF4_9HYPH|nr:DUF883 domain-containing protein [Pseudohoeflea sp. DP4N28-3]MBW3097290.1 DUF883 family protein [Pseudohoeflea sp. DP4N28-3]
MARATAARTKADVSGASDRPGATGDIGADVEAQISHLKGEMAKLAEAVSNAGSVIATDVKGNARVRSRQLRQTSQETLADLREQLDEIERQVSGHVRERPLASIAAAAGVGFLIALLTRR